MGLSFNDLDTDLQRSVFAAVSILCIVLLLCLISFIHYAFIILTALASGFMAYKLFLAPKLRKHREENHEAENLPDELGVDP